MTAILVAALAVSLTTAPTPSGAAEPTGGENGPVMGGPDRSTAPGQSETHQIGPTRSYKPGLGALLDAQASILGDRWAGSSVEADGSALVGLTPGPVPSPLASHRDVRIVTRRFSINRLNGVMELVTARLNPLLNPGVKPGTPGRWPYDAKIADLENVVDVRVDRGHETRMPAVEAALADERAAGTLRIHVGDVPTLDNDCSSRESCAFPIRGGTKLTSVGSCTTGFVFRRWDGVRFQSTAGHCDGSYYNHAGWQIGPVHFFQNHGSVDARIIEHNNQGQNAPANFVYRTTNTATNVPSKVVNPSTGINVTVCQNGFYSGEGCGVVNATNHSFNGRPGFGKHATPNSCGGDSGGPVLATADNKAFGMHVGSPHLPGQTCSGPTDSSYFSWVSNIEAASGFQVLTTPTTETLGPGQRMHAFDRLTSVDGRFDLKMQDDGNLVVYQGATPLWSSNTWGNPGAFVVMQNDGNLVIYKSGGTAIWARGCCVAGTRLVMQNDSNLVMYQPGGGTSWNRYWG